MNSRFQFRYSKKLLGNTRKNARKASRLEKKLKKSRPAEIAVQAPVPQKNDTNKQPPSEKNKPKKIHKVVAAMDNDSITRKKLAKLEAKNPVMFKMLQGTSVGKFIDGGSSGHGVGTWSAEGSNAFSREDNEIEYYSKKLGLKEKALKNALKKDGLDDLIDDNMHDATGSTSDILKDLEYSDSEFDDNLSDSNNHNLNSESETDNDDQMIIDKEPQTKTESKATKPEPARYIPPRLREKQSTESEEYMLLSRTIKGHLNKLTDSNMESIISQMESLYQTNSRNNVTTIITNSIMNSISDHTNPHETFVTTYGAFIATLFNLPPSCGGLEFGAHVIQTSVETYLDSSTPPKKSNNLALLLCTLFNFDVCSSILIYDLLEKCLDEFNEDNIERVVRIIRICGAGIRKNDPNRLKSIILKVQNNIQTINSTARGKFMVESVMDLKNNKIKKNGADGASMGIQFDNLCKFISGFLKKRGVGGRREPLRVSLLDISDISTRGKWWLVGSAWAGRDDSQHDNPESTNIILEGGVDLLGLAKSMRMSTDIKKSIFVILMSSEDCDDAYQKLTALKLKSKQEREIARVILQCVISEKEYNPYYALVASKFCTLHSYKITFQYALWDSIREYEEYSLEETKDFIRHVRFTAKFYSWLVNEGYLGLIILKTIDYTAMSKYTKLFCVHFFTRLFSHFEKICDTAAQDNHLVLMFTRLRELEGAKDLCIGLEYFFTTGMKSKIPEVNERVKIVKAVLSERD